MEPRRALVGLPRIAAAAAVTLGVLHIQRSSSRLESLSRRVVMTKNMGTADRTVRILLALAVAVLYFTGTISGTLAIVLGIVAVAFVVTSFIGWCPAYLPFNLSTRKRAGGPPAAT
jgi:hypothetical protein